MADLLFQYSVLLKADGVKLAFSLQSLVKLRDGKSGIPSKEAHDVALCVARNDACQKSFPVIRAVDVALAQGTAFQMAELIEHKQRVITLAPEVTVPSRAFLIAMGGADGTVHAQRDPFGRLCRVHRVDPLAR